MLPNGLYTLRGPIRSGKTTALKTWVQQFDRVSGILTPDGDQGLRLMYDIGTEAFYPFEMGDKEEGASINIGRFRFRKEAFEKGNRILQHAMHTKPEAIVIDEWGKLEKKGEGFAVGCELLLSAVLRGTLDTILVVVVRDSLYDDFIAYCASLIPSEEAVCSPSILHLPS